jgi:ribose 5-phosphate isomerase A
MRDSRLSYPLNSQATRGGQVTAGEGDDRKRRAAVRAADFIRDGMVLGLGTGSTVRYLLDEIGARRAAGEWAGIVGVPTSEDTARRARSLGIPIATLADHPVIDLTIDGADEVDPQLDLIKGLGGALMREKIVASVSRAMVVIVDETKIVDRLGTRAPLPVEVEPFAAAVLVPFFRELGADPSLRLDQGGDPYRTDGGNLIFDCRFPAGIEDARALDAALDRRPGVLENGLFIGMARRVVVASADGLKVLSRPEEV